MTTNMIALAPTQLTQLEQCAQTRFAATVLRVQAPVQGVSPLSVSGRPTLASDAHGVPFYAMANVAAFAGPDTRVRIAKHSRPPRGEPAE